MRFSVVCSIIILLYNEEIKNQEGEVTCQTSHNYYVHSTDLNSFLNSKPHAVN